MDNHHVSVWGRTFEEYAKMFCLTNLKTSDKILSIADGPSTFNLEGRQKGFDITSVDPIYNLENRELVITFEKSYDFNKNLFLNNKEKFVLKSEEEIEQILSKRRNTFNQFLIDYNKNRLRYHYGILPSLNFQTNSFDLCLCSNFLFIFDHVFDLDFHLHSIDEMLRVSEEVRIFPLYNIHGKQSDFLNVVIDCLQKNKSYNLTIQNNDYYIYKNGNKFLNIKKMTE